MQMENYTITEKLPTPTEYNDLRVAVGWGAYPENIIQRSLPHSLYCVCAYVEDQIVGMARVIGDGGLVYYIQDVIVLPSCQRQGIGRAMMDRVMAYLRAHASHNTILGLMAAVGKEPFYESYGFAPRPTDQLGCGMTRFWSFDTP